MHWILYKQITKHCDVTEGSGSGSMPTDDEDGDDDEEGSGYLVWRHNNCSLNALLEN